MMYSCLYVTYKVVGYDPSYGGILLTKMGVTRHSFLQDSMVPASITTANNAGLGRIRAVLSFVYIDPIPVQENLFLKPVPISQVP